MWDDYVWIVVVGAFLAFFTAYGIGANDVANAFATSVGAKAITITQAVFVASILEFAGAVLLGSHVTDTVSNKIADKAEFEDDPEILMYGMLCVLAAIGIWLTLASFLEMPVSTSHAVIGGIVGMALAFKGSHAVVWYEYDSSKSDLDRYKGLWPVILSWIASPLLSGCCAVILFLCIRTLILRQALSEQRAYVFFPLLVGLTVAINTYFVIYKGFRRKFEYQGNKQTVKTILGVWVNLLALGIATLSALLVYRFVVPHLRKKIERDRQMRMGDLQERDDIPDGNQEVQNPDAHPVGSPVGNRPRGWNGASFFDHDIHGIVEDDATVHRIHETAEDFDHDTEEVFKYLQVLTSICDAFEHGANDVANAIGPFASIFMVYRREAVRNEAAVPEWILVLGGAGIVVGLATYGYNIIRAIGVKLIKVTASRGFSIELGAAMVITLGSQYGLPLSTTHCQVGATVGVGLLQGKSGVNFWLLMRMIAGWIGTFVVVGCMTAFFFVQGSYTPSIVNLRTIDRIEAGLIEISELVGKELGIDVYDKNVALENDKKDDSEDQLNFVKELVRRLVENRTMGGR